jgi:hypothetical protein
MKSPDLLSTRNLFGSKDIGDRWVTTTSGCEDIGSVLRLKGPAGRIRTTTTIGKAGNGTKDTGTKRTTTMTIGGTMIVDGGIAIMTTRRMSTNLTGRMIVGVVGKEVQ